MRGNQLQDTTLSTRGDGLNIRYVWFLSIGVGRNYGPTDLPDSSPPPIDRLSESSGSRICRRNILALACILILAGSAGGDPQELSVFGLKISGERGFAVLWVGAIVAHLYWYAMRFHHLKEDGEVQQFPDNSSAARRKFPITDQYYVARHAGDLWANRAAACLTPVSWLVFGLWFCGLLA